MAAPRSRSAPTWSSRRSRSISSPSCSDKTTDRIEDIWQSCYDSSYWKNGPVLNNAISGIDQALWDIKGRQAGMPVYQLAGGKCREAADTYAHASGAEFEDVVDNAKQYMAQGFRNVRVQVGLPGMAGYGSHTREPTPLQGAARQAAVRSCLRQMRRASEAS